MLSDNVDVIYQFMNLTNLHTDRGQLVDAVLLSQLVIRSAGLQLATVCSIRVPDVRRTVQSVLYNSLLNCDKLVCMRVWL